MLHTETVSVELLGLMTQLMEVEDLGSLRLVGGTALAFQLGHRTSIDIDLFGEHTLHADDLTAILRDFGQVEIVRESASINIYFVNGIKVDFVNYPYGWLDTEVTLEKIRMASIRDIAAMKIAAIANRGSKKDFIDLYFLLQHYSLADIFTFYKDKITDGNEWMALRSLSYFDDAEQQPMPDMFQDVSWPTMKSHIQDTVRIYAGD